MNQITQSTEYSAPLSKRPQVAIVIPVFKHSSLALEAISSVRGAAETGDAHIVIVDDGCPYFQTLFSASLSSGGRIHYVRQVNSGLSGARNCGIDFVLENLPNCEGIFFLDADNRLSSFSVSRFTQLLIREPDYDWFYPDINMIGIPWSGDYSGRFRCITESLMNICEAGSLVRRRVFESGCRFDEKMRAGYEDWEFWISLMERGFVGANMPGSGFLYRKRAESMLADSARRNDEIMEYIETKHWWMRDLPTLVRLEHFEAPRYAVICSDSSTVLLGSDPMAFREISSETYSDALHLSQGRPNWATAGAIIVYASKALLHQLRDAGLLQSIFWRGEVELTQANFVSVEIVEGDGEYYRQGRSANISLSDMLIINVETMRSVFADSKTDWIEKLAFQPDEIGCVGLKIEVPTLQVPNEAFRYQRQELVHWVRREKLKGIPPLWSGRPQNKHEGTPDLSLTATKLQAKFQSGVLPCRMKDQTKWSVAMILPIMEFGGVEKVALRVACELRRNGFRVDLVMFGNSRAHNYEAFSDAYDQIYILDHISQAYGGSVYEGTYLPSNLSISNPEIENLLRAYDVVINSHAAGSLYSFANLRRSGVVTVDYLHLIEFTRRGRGTGHPVIGLAFEHSIDIMACCSDQMAHQLAALGVPREKIIAVPNGPGAFISSADTEEAARMRDGALRPRLNVLYFGRLDVQKGLDRLSQIAQALNVEGDMFDLRIIGDRVVDSETLEDFALQSEPAIYDEAEIAATYRWADVIIMPSRFEGLPLTVIEAMMLGAVPIVTDVGALAELISDGENGYLIQGMDVVSQMIDRLRHLARNPHELKRLRHNARETAEVRDWATTTAPLIQKISLLLKQRDAKRSFSPTFGIFESRSSLKSKLQGVA
ncbi:glycosyltransferase [Rhizobium freirei]|nr:glycosyltransferase [Rhizobium freirei]